MVMSAQFNLCARRTGNPSFFVHLKPRFGDFGIRKKQASVFAENGNKMVDVLIPVIGEIFEVLGMNKFRSLNDKLLKGVEIGADKFRSLNDKMVDVLIPVTSLPLMNLSNVKCQWGVRFPTEMKDMSGVKDGFVINRLPPAVSFRSFPFQVMNKISIERVRGGTGKDISKVDTVTTPLGAVEGDMKMMCPGVMHQLEALREENGTLRKAVDGLRSEISGGKRNTFGGEIKHKEVCRGAGNKTKDVTAEGRSADSAKEDAKKC